MSGHSAEKDAGACVRATALREVITEAIAEAEKHDMKPETRDNWIAIRILGSSLIPLRQHFPSEGGGLCPVCNDGLTPEQAAKERLLAAIFPDGYVLPPGGPDA
jgi:hypothetical protein